MMDDDGNICDVGDYRPEYKRYIVSIRKPSTQEIVIWAFWARLDAVVFRILLTIRLDV